jgi:hypothetical protein
MKNRRWGLRVLVAGIWVMAMLTWGSIGHYLFGLADLGPLLAVIAVVVVLAWPLRTREKARAPMPAERDLPSQA